MIHSRRPVVHAEASRHGPGHVRVGGVFAAGGVRHGSTPRVASGVSEGAMAVKFVHTYLTEPAQTEESLDQPS